MFLFFYFYRCKSKLFFCIVLLHYAAFLLNSFIANFHHNFHSVIFGLKFYWDDKKSIFYLKYARIEKKTLCCAIEQRIKYTVTKIEPFGSLGHFHTANCEVWKRTVYTIGDIKFFFQKIDFFQVYLPILLDNTDFSLLPVALSNFHNNKIILKY